MVTFMRVFEIFCDYLNIGTTIPLFLYCFHLHGSEVDGKWGWVTLKQGNGKWFKAYLESVWHFKHNYILVQPLSSRTMLNIFWAAPVHDDNGPPF